MSDRFTSVATLAPVLLDASVPFGLFRVVGTDQASLFWVVSGPPGSSRRTAIVLASPMGQMVFQSWGLEDGQADWNGIALGEAEILVDTASGEWIGNSTPSLGQIAITGSKVLLGVSVSNGPHRTAIEVGTSSGGQAGSGVSFSRWQLVQRDALGVPIVLFAHPAPAKADGSAQPDR